MGTQKLTVIGLFILIMGVFQYYWLVDFDLREAHAERHLDEAVARGVVLYAENCVVCHGNRGQGVVGPSVNRDGWRDGTEFELEAAGNFLYRTIARGRTGTTATTWTFLDDGRIRSHTEMPGWHAEDGGPFNEQMVNDLVAFLQHGDFRQVDRHIPDPFLPGDVERLEADHLPVIDDLPSAIDQLARETLIRRGCMDCHAIGGQGAFIGPELGDTALWIGQDRDMLRAWISNPAAFPGEDRLPHIWLHDAEIDQELDRNVTQMPAMGLTEEELDAVVEYLHRLDVTQ